MPGVRLTLIGRDVETPYSGMIPGFVAGHYTFDECHIDLAWLCASTGARLVHAEATGIDRASRQVLLKDRPAVSYDLLSIDVGSAPNLETIAGRRPMGDAGEADRRARPALAGLPRAHEELAGPAQRHGDRRRRGRRRARAGDRPSAARGRRRRAQLQVTLATKDEILAGQAAAARAGCAQSSSAAGCGCWKRPATVRIERGAVQLENGKWLQADAVFVVTEASAAEWFATTGLPLDESGFLAVDDTLRSTGDERIFAAGDCADRAEASAAQGRRVRRAPRPAARGESAACRAGPGTRAVRAAAPLSLDHRHRRRPRRGDARRGRSKAPGCGAGRTTSIASGCACTSWRI